jgi:hypothetical protein
VNPVHLSTGLPVQNTADMIAKGRKSVAAPRGERSGKARLNEAAVRVIRASEKTNAALGRELGVSIGAVRSVRIGRTWSHVS